MLLQTQQEPLAFLQLRAFCTWQLSRGVFETRFGIKPTAARDLGIYRGIAPGNLDRDTARTRYRPTASFIPIFDSHTARLVAWLLQGFDDGLELGLRLATPCEGSGQLMRQDMSVWGVITRATCAKRPIRFSDLSMSSRRKRREIAPVVLADIGLHWHARAFDRERRRFADFVLTRKVKAPSPDHWLDPSSHRLCTRNTPTIYGIEGAALVPGAELQGHLSRHRRAHAESSMTTHTIIQKGVSN